MADLAEDLCGGTINVKKLVDGEPAEGWEFSTDVTGGSSDPSSGQTAGDGFITFNIDIDNGSATVDITETTQQGYKLEDAMCWVNFDTDDEEEVGEFNDDDTVIEIDIEKNDIVYCEFENTLQTFCGDEIQQDLNDDELIEECDGTDGVGEHQSCSNTCELVNLTYCGDEIQQDLNDDELVEECDGTDGVGDHQECGEPETRNACEIINLTYCGDGTTQDQGNDEQTGGPENDGVEECDGNAPEGFSCVSCTLIALEDELVCGTKYHDLNENQVQDNEESGLSGWTIKLQEFFNEAWDTLFTEETDSDGLYCFEEVEAGDYRVIEVLQSGWTNTTPLAVEFSLSANQQILDKDFGNIFICTDNDEDGYSQEGSFCGVVDCDDTEFSESNECIDPFCGDGEINGEEVCDGELGEFGDHQACGAPESDFACEIINLTYCGDETTQEEGNDEGTGGPEDDGIEECDAGPEGSEQCTSSCELIVNSPENSICGYKFFDTNQNGEFDKSEDGIENWKFFASIEESTPKIETTKEDGWYCFNALAPGMWDIFEELWSLPGNWATTTDATTTVELGEFKGIDNINFGNILCTDNDEDSYNAEGGFCGEQDCNDDAFSESNTCGDGGGGGGGGGGSGPTPLILHTEAAEGTTNDGLLEVTISWFTNKLADTRVLYDTETHDGGDPAPNYGYQWSTALADSDPKVTFHAVTISDLEPNTAYYFRPISSASPETQGIELEFTTGDAPEPPITPPTPPGDGGGTPGGGGAPIPEDETGTVAGVEFEETTTPEVIAEEDIVEEDETIEDATPVASTKDCTAYIWILLIINIIALAYAASRSKEVKGNNKKNAWWILTILVIVPVILGYAECWLVVWLLIMLIIEVILISALNKKNEDAPPLQSV